MRMTFAAIAASLFLFSCTHLSSSPAQQYAEKIRHLIVTNDRERLSQLEVFPGYSMNEDQLDWVFADGGRFPPIREFLLRPNIVVGLVGPFEYAADTGGQAYRVLFYDPSTIGFDALKRMDGYGLEELWGDGYVSTILIEFEGRMQLYRTPFFYGTHLPGAPKNYGASKLFTNELS